MARGEDPGDEVEEALPETRYRSFLAPQNVLCDLESKWREFPSVFALLETVSKLKLMQIFYYSCLFFKLEIMKKIEQDSRIPFRG